MKKDYGSSENVGEVLIEDTGRVGTKVCTEAENKPHALWKEQGRCSHEAEENVAEWVGEASGGHSCSGKFTDPGNMRAAQLAPHGCRITLYLGRLILMSGHVTDASQLTRLQVFMKQER